MYTTRRQNIIIFSAGSSEENGNLKKVKSFFPEEKYHCSDWRELFANARNKKSISILPMLIKKIPTFDFAIILGDGVDNLNEFRGQELSDDEKICIMRDNVLFECGMCIMALGRDRVILLIENDVRIPEDLVGGVGMLGVKYYEYSNEEEGDLKKKLQQAKGHMKEYEDKISPVVIGAAISTADGYLSNFILRFWEYIGNGFLDNKIKKEFPHDISRIRMDICIPEKNEGQIGGKAKQYFKDNNYREGLITDGGPRSVAFWYKEEKGEFIICDIPTTMTASYNTVKDILHLSADEETHDTNAEERFLTKERDSFRFTLKKLMADEVLTSKLKAFPYYKKNETKVTQILQMMKRVHIKKIDL